MFIIPLCTIPSEIEYAKDENDIFDLLFEPSYHTADTYVGLTSNSIIVAGMGTVTGKVAFQYRLREWIIGNEINIPQSLGNVGFMGTFPDLPTAIAKTFPWKDSTSYCLDNGHVVKYTGQKLKAIKDNWKYIQPIMCLISRTPVEKFNHFLEVFKYDTPEDFTVRGNWRNNLTLYCYGKEVKLDDWYLEFAKCTIGCKEDKNDDLGCSGCLSIIGIIILIGMILSH